MKKYIRIITDEDLNEILGDVEVSDEFLINLIAAAKKFGPIGNIEFVDDDGSTKPAIAFENINTFAVFAVSLRLASTPDDIEKLWGDMIIVESISKK